MILCFQQSVMESKDLAFLDSVLKRRQIALWNAILQHYEVSHDLNKQVHDWIRKGQITEKAYDVATYRAKHGRTKN